MEKNLYSKLHKMYEVQKTIRFELKPIGKTKENMENMNFLEKDKKRALGYQKVKTYFDEYHKEFIDECMKKHVISIEKLKEFENLYNMNNKNDENKIKMRQIQEELRNDIASEFSKNTKYKGLFGKEMINNYLLEKFKEDGEKIKDLESFKKFTTYFSGFNENRRNMYTAEAKSTSIANRIINENLPDFLNNIRNYNIFKLYLKDDFERIEKELIKNLDINSVDEFFEISYFNNVLTQDGIDKYNEIIGGKSLEDNKKIKGINEYINEAKMKLPNLKVLYKQILSDKNQLSFVFESIDNDNDVVCSIKEYNKKIELYLSDLKNIFEKIDLYDLDKIYLNNDISLTRIANELYEDWNYINVKTREFYNKENVKFEKKKIYSIKELNEILDDEKVLIYIKDIIENNNIIKNVEIAYKDIEKLVNTNYDNKKVLQTNAENIKLIKTYLDYAKELNDTVKLLIPKEEFLDKDEKFYSELEKIYEETKNIIPIYNKIRNYLTQKPYSNKKIKLNFENDTLLSGWDLNKEKDNLGILLKKDNKYFLGIINPEDKKIFDEYEESSRNYEKIIYKQIPNAAKYLSSKQILPQNPPTEIVDILKKKKENSKSLSLDEIHTFIDYCRNDFLINYSCLKDKNGNNFFDFKFKDTKEYKTLNEFFMDVDKQAYIIKYSKVSEEYIDDLVEKGKLFLFQIYNKDFSEYGKGKDNLHTMYWKALFNEKNMLDIVYKLNGNAEIFFRESSLNINDTAIHEKNIPINNKNEFNNKKQSVFNYDIIKDRRYTVDKFQFNVPISLNYSCSSERLAINKCVNEYLKENDVNVIGIDRGERNLVYITVINSKGEILEQHSLNKIVNEYKDISFTTDYHKLLSGKEDDKNKARQSWQEIENIKELKEGYISQVVHKIALLLDKYKAIIVMEDLNKGFKNSRIKFEKQVYQKFEKALIEKLNYLIFKDKEYDEEGGLYNAYQLTNKFDGFNFLGKQSGIIFYVPAWCTSKIDPVTGFVNLINFKYESIQKSKDLISKYNSIVYNEIEDVFEFDMDYDKFTNKAYGIRNNWVLSTYGERIRNESEEINLTKEFKKLFHKNDVKYEIKHQDLKEKILENEKKEFWVEFMNLMKLLYQLRNSKSKTSIDYMISPIKDNFGNNFDTRKALKDVPIDADANGAYNIARKGLMVIDKIRESNNDKIKFNITNEEWLIYVQKKNNGRTN